MTFRKYDIQKALINALLLVLVLATACVEEDDGSDVVVPPLDPVLAFVPATITEGFTEGDDAQVEVGWFSGVENTGNIAVTFSYSGDISGTGNVSIPSGELTTTIDLFSLGVTDDLIAQGAREVTLTLTGGDFPLNDPEINTFLPISFTYTIEDDIINFGLESSTEVVTEVDGLLTLPLPASGLGGIDEVITVEYEIDASSTAVQDVDFELTQGLTFTYDPEVDTLESSPSIKLRLLDDLLEGDTLNLTVNIVDVSGSDEVVFVDTLANSVTYRIVDDLKTFSFDTDTLEVTAAGNYGFDVDIAGALFEQASVEVNETAALPGYFSVSNDNELVYLPGESSKTFGFSIAESAFTGSGNTTYIGFTLENISTRNGDDEVVIDPGADTLIIAVVD